MLQARQLFTTIFTALFRRQKTQMMTRLILVVTAAMLFPVLMMAFASCTISNGGSPSPPTSPQIGLHVGEKAPDFTLTNLDGKKVSLSDYRGKPVMLNFWYPSCSDCVDEIPIMQRYYTSAQAIKKHFVILAVNFVDDKQTVQKFVQKMHLTYPIAMDDHQRVATMYHVRETPTSYFLDPQGIIQSVLIGPVKHSFLRRVLADPHRANRKGK